MGAFLIASDILFDWTNREWGKIVISSIIPVSIGLSIRRSAQENGALTKYFRQSMRPTWGRGCRCPSCPRVDARCLTGVYAGNAFLSLTPLGYASYHIFKNSGGMMTDDSQVALALYGSCMALLIISGYVIACKDYQKVAYIQIGIAGTAVAFSLAFSQIDNTAFYCSLPFVGWSIFAGLYHFKLYQLNVNNENEIL